MEPVILRIPNCHSHHLLRVLLSVTSVDFDVVRNVSTQWSMEIGNCCGLDGSYLTGTILETLAFELEDPHDTGTGRRAPPVASILQYTDCRTIIATIATLIQLQWIFQHPTPTIFQLLSSQEGSDPSRDFLLLKGVLEHGLANELEFRVQGTSMTRSEVENRIVLFTKVLFKRLQALEKQETIRSLKRKYSTLLGA